MQKITETNWNFCCFQLGRHRAFISLGGEPNNFNSTDVEQMNFIYYVTIVDLDGNEVEQQSFPNLSLAIDRLNASYGHWPFVDQTQSEAGCGSCHAH